jgi:hypothetical protein
MPLFLLRGPWCCWCCVLQVAEMFKLDKQGKAVVVQVFYDLVC